jgi:mannose-6-phosphate isomerase-like protein (cupin superfamily)
MNIQRARSAHAKYEYGCDLRRLYPWAGVANPFWGAAIASVRVGEKTSLHGHDESETFLVLSGQGRLTIDGESEVLEQGDIVFIPKGAQHEFENLSPTATLDFLTIFWDSPEARQAIATKLANNEHDL